MADHLKARPLGRCAQLRLAPVATILANPNRQRVSRQINPTSSTVPHASVSSSKQRILLEKLSPPAADPKSIDGGYRPGQACRRHGSPHRCLAPDEKSAGSIRPPRRGFPPANLFPHRHPNLMVMSDFGSRMGAAMSAQVRLDAVIVAAGRFLTSPDIGYSVTRYRAPCACCRPRRRGSNRFAVCGATPQTAVIIVVTRRYSSRLLNFAAHSPEDSQRDRKCRCTRLERTVPGIVPVQNWAVGTWLSRDLGVVDCSTSPVFGPARCRLACMFMQLCLCIAVSGVNVRFCRESGDDGDQLSLIIQARMSSSRRFVSWPSRRTAGSW